MFKNILEQDANKIIMQKYGIGKFQYEHIIYKSLMHGFKDENVSIETIGKFGKSNKPGDEGKTHAVDYCQNIWKPVMMTIIKKKIIIRI